MAGIATVSNWSLLCSVDIAPLAAWLAEGDKAWPAPSTPTKPQRIRGIPGELLEPIYAKVIPDAFGMADSLYAADPMLSRMLPGQSHPYHVDRQRADWITRVHVPITTNPGAWLMFEPEGQRIHFEAGKAYSFNTLERHSFGNDGATERVHLIFEVLRRDA